MPSLNDLTGQRFGLLTVMERVHYPGEKQGRWFCVCDCGGSTATWTGHLVQGRTKSCGCKHHPKKPPSPAKKSKRGRKPKDRTGERHGLLTILRREGKCKWRCKCDCGKEVVRGSSLFRNEMPSCGCDRRKEPGKAARSRLLARYRRDAKNRGYRFSLSTDEFKSLLERNCCYCGAEPAQIFRDNRKNDLLTYNGIDRVDNSQGYTIENCVPCCGMCNIMKRSMSKGEFLEHIARISAHQKTT